MRIVVMTVAWRSESCRRNRIVGIMCEMYAAAARTMDAAEQHHYCGHASDELTAQKSHGRMLNRCPSVVKRPRS
jgi:hypothetical protein